MDRISKFLKKLSQKERTVVVELLEQLYSEKTQKLNIKKLRGIDDVFRVRKGNIRIIFRRLEGDIKVLEIGRRDEDTYKAF